MMPSTPDPMQPLSLTAIHEKWTQALAQPPTTRLSSLRHLLRAILKSTDTVFSPAKHLTPFYLDLGLTYAFLGEYYLASQAFHEAVEADNESAVGWFALGLARAELGEWREAKRAWERCLRCFEPKNGEARTKYIKYKSFQPPEETSWILDIGIEDGEWALERTRVEWNWRVALFEKGSKTAGVEARNKDQKRLGLNGIPAGFRFGPGWEAERTTFARPSLVAMVDENGVGRQERISWARKPILITNRPTPLRLQIQTQIAKPITPVLSSPHTHAPSLARGNSYYNDSPTIGTFPPRTSSLATSSNTSSSPFHSPYHHISMDVEPPSARSTLSSPLSYYFSAKSENGDDNERELRTIGMIDKTIAQWKKGSADDVHPAYRRDQKEEHEDNRMEDEEGNDNAEAFMKLEGHGGEILLSRTFEGFGNVSRKK